MTPPEHDMLLRIFCWLVWSAVAMYFGYKLRGWQKPEPYVLDMETCGDGKVRVKFKRNDNEGESDAL